MKTILSIISFLVIAISCGANPNTNNVNNENTETNMSTEGLAIKGGSVNTSDKAIEDWINKNKK